MGAGLNFDGPDISEASDEDPEGSPSDQYMYSFDDQEYKPKDAEDTRIATRLTKKSTIMSKSNPDKMSVFLAKKNFGNNMYSLPEKTAKDN